MLRFKSRSLQANASSKPKILYSYYFYFLSMYKDSSDVYISVAARVY